MNDRPASRRRAWLERLLHLHDTPRRTAAAFALGVFFSFSPFIGLQVLCSFAIAFALGLNRLAVFVGLNTNLPWLLAPWYVGTTMLAAAALGMSLPPDFGQHLRALLDLGPFSASFWTGARDLVRPFLLPYLIGPTVGAAFIGLAAYPATRTLLERRARAQARQALAATAECRVPTAGQR
jgi:uncharacterized protein (DUF2062 family)